MSDRRMHRYAVLLALLLLPGITAAAVDLHRLWDSRCGECHGHSADFARQFLQLVDGKLQGRHHVDDLYRFLGQHYTPQSHVEALHAMLAAQTQTPPLFAQECSRCHGSAAEFARARLEFHKGQAVSRKSGITTREFMRQHRNLEAEMVDFYVKLLTRVAREVGLE